MQRTARLFRVAFGFRQGARPTQARRVPMMYIIACGGRATQHEVELTRKRGWRAVPPALAENSCGCFLPDLTRFTTMQCGAARRRSNEGVSMPAMRVHRQRGAPPLSLQGPGLMLPFPEHSRHDSRRDAPPIARLPEEFMSTIESVLHENRVFPPNAELVKQANISGMDAYRKLCAEAEKDFEGFWARLAREEVLWHKPFTKVLDESNAPFFKWFEDGQLNASYNSLDRHLKTQPDKTAIVFEADDGKVTKISYRELHRRTCQFANGLKSRGIRKGDRVIIYMPMSIEAVAAMQACARIGAVHSVV